MTNDSPSRAKVGIGIGEGGAVLPEVAVEGAGEALEGDAEAAVQALEHRHRQRHLRQLRLAARARAHPRRVAPQHAPHARQKLLELLVVEAAVAVQAFLKPTRLFTCLLSTHSFKMSTFTSISSVAVEDNLFKLSLTDSSSGDAIINVVK